MVVLLEVRMVYRLGTGLVLVPVHSIIIIIDYRDLPHMSVCRP